MDTFHDWVENNRTTWDTVYSSEYEEWAAEVK